MPMNSNIGLADRLIRLILTIVFVVFGFIYGWGWFIPAALLLITAITGWCCLYTLFGWNTCSTSAKTTAKSAAPKKTAKKRKK